MEKLILFKHTERFIIDYYLMTGPVILKENVNRFNNINYKFWLALKEQIILYPVIPKIMLLYLFIILMLTIYLT